MEFAEGGIPFENLPPEIQEIVRAQMHQHELQHMAIEGSRHRMLNFLEGLDEEGLQCVRGLIQLVNAADETAGFYMGFTAVLLSKFQYCPICGVKHDDPRDHPEETVKTDVEKERLLQRDTADMPTRTRTITPEETAQMVMYDIKPHKEGGYVCTNCGKQYVSIEDRMLRDPGPAGCDGCKQTTKWGGTEPTYDPTIGDN